MTTTEHRNPAYAECHLPTLLAQIGGWNLAAISGGRWGEILQGDRKIGVDLPVGNGYRVHVVYLADDTYRVTRVRQSLKYVGDLLRGYQTVINRLGSETGVYAKQVGESAYRASCYLDDGFGEPEPSDA